MPNSPDNLERNDLDRCPVNPARCLPNSPDLSSEDDRSEISKKLDTIKNELQNLRENKKRMN